MILNALKRNNIKTGLGRYPVRPKSKNIDISFFEKIDSNIKAYILGLIYSDGSIDKNGYGFSFVSKDYDQVLLFKNSLKSEHKICKISSFDKRTKKTYIRYTIHICSKKMTSDLLKLGLKNDKSFNCEMPKISNDLIWHFIRGLFDGDGCVTKTSNKIGKISFSIILSGTLNYFIKNFFNEIGLNNTKDQIKNSSIKGNIYSLKYSSYKDLKCIYDNMYLNSNNLRLERKFIIFSTLKEYKRGSYIRKSKKVKMIKDGEVIKLFNSIKEINGFSIGRIYQSIKFKTKYKGFYFEFL